MVRCWRGYLSGARCRLAYAQLMPLPLTVSCFSIIQIDFTFLVLAHPGSPRKRAVKRACVCNSCFMAIFRDKSVIWFHLGSTPSPRFSEDNTGILVGWVFYRPAVLPAPCKISITAQRRTLVTSTNHESGLVHSSSTTKLLT